MLDYENNFRLYLNDPNIYMNNNSAECEMRKNIIGKKNWMFIGSERARKSKAVLYSLI